jgi:RNA polymerase sigma-70 factor (ECF subfamily)
LVRPDGPWREGTLQRDIAIGKPADDFRRAPSLDIGKTPLPAMTGHLTRRSTMMHDDQSFQAQFLAQLPALRGHARMLAQTSAQADDLVQETMLKAWANRHRFERGTHLRAWLFTIQRNAFYSAYRKYRREVADVDGAHADRLTEPPSQDHALILNDFFEAFTQLSAEQRAALVLIGAAGLSYDEAADVTGVAAGTVKSRVSRARSELADRLDVDHGSELVSDTLMDAAIGQMTARAA